MRARALHLVVATVVLLALAPTPQSQLVRSWVNRARSSLLAGHPSAAEVQLAALLVFEPDSPRVRLATANAALNAGKAAEAAALLEAVSPPADLAAPWHCLQARAVVAAGKVQDVKAVASQLADSCPPDVPEWQDLVESALRNGETGDALTAADAWVEMDPESELAALDQSLAAALIHPQSALPSLRKILAANPNPPTLVLDLDRTIEDSMATQDPAYRLAQVGQTLARNNRWDLASLAFQAALNLEPNYIEAQAYLGLSMDHLGQDGGTLLQSAAAAASRAALPHAFLGWHWATHGEPKKAAAELAAASTLEPDNAAIAAQLGAAEEALGDMQAARQDYEKAVQLQPKSAGFWLILARFSLDNEIDVAHLGLAAARQAALLSPGDPDAFDDIGLAYYLQGEPRLAVHMCSHALNLDPSSPSALYHLGLAALAMGDTQRAAGVLRAAAQFDPGGPYAELAQRALSKAGP